MSTWRVGSWVSSVFLIMNFGSPKPSSADKKDADDDATINLIYNQIPHHQPQQLFLRLLLQRQSIASRIIFIMEAAAKQFFTSPRFAVAGASQDTSKFGYKSEFWISNAD